MAYVKTNWVDDVTPLSATNMNNIENGLSQVSKVNAYQSLETTKLRMELVLTQLNSVGFYDLFNTIDDVNALYTNATVDTGAQDVTFLGEIYNLTVASDVTSSTAVTTKEKATIGDKIDDTNVITDVVDSPVFYDIATGMSYDSVNFSVASQEASPSSITFNNDGTKLFMVGYASDAIYQYSLPTPFILTGMSYDSISFNITSQESNPQSITFNNDGTKLFVVGTNNATIYQYSLPTPFILTGMSYDSISFSVASQEPNPRSISFNNDGTKLFMLGNNATIYQYSLPTPFILTGMSYDSVSFSVASQDTSARSISFNNDGTKLFVVGTNNDTIHQYSTSELLFDLTLTSPITALADDVLSVYPSAYPYDTLSMISQQFAVTGDNSIVKLYTEDINNPLDLKYQMFINGVECSLVETLDYELTFELANINSDTITLKVNGKDGVVLDNLLVAIS